jgi:hypothetical protein
MLNSLPMLWVVAMLTQIVVLSLAYRSQSTGRFFKYFILFESIASPSVFVFYQSDLKMAYFYSFFATLVIGDVLTLLVAYEIYMAVFGPRKALPRFVPERTGALVAMAFSGALALGIYVHAVTGGRLMRTMVTLEQILTTATWAIFMVLLIYSLTLRIAWPRRIAGLTMGFILYLTIDIAAVFVRAHSEGETSVAAGMAGQSAYIFSLFWWVACLRHKESISAPIAAEQVALMAIYHRQSMELLGRSLKTQTETDK